MPYEVELCVAEVGATAEQDQMFRLTYDGSIVDEPRYVVMGGNTDPISTALKDTFNESMELGEALGVAVRALSKSSSASAASSSSSSSANNNGNASELLGPEKLEVAILDRARPRRAFRRISGEALTTLLPSAETPPPAADEPKKDEPPAPDTNGGE